MKLDPAVGSFVPMDLDGFEEASSVESPVKKKKRRRTPQQLFHAGEEHLRQDFLDTKLVTWISTRQAVPFTSLDSVDRLQLNCRLGDAMVDNKWGKFPTYQYNTVRVCGLAVLGFEEYCVDNLALQIAENRLQFAINNNDNDIFVLM